jgi:ATP-dependent DNA helicase RecG
MKELMTERELRQLLQREEGQFLEFKSLWDLGEGTARAVSRRAVRDWIAEQTAAFANAEGGTLVLGVDDDGTPSGHGYPDEAIERFLAVPGQGIPRDPGDDREGGRLASPGFGPWGHLPPVSGSADS